jgi:TetR/AcrR family transcriptional repressor of nem operon
MKGNETKDKIIKGALELFHSKGYHDTSINDIMQSASIKKGGLYFHIQSKEKLAVEVLEEALLNYEALISEGLGNLSPLEQLERKIKAIVRYHETTGLHKGCLFGNMALEIGMNDSEISLFLKKVFLRWEASFENMIRNAVDKGELRLKESSRQLSVMILAVIEGGIMLSKITGDMSSLKKCADFIIKIIREREIDQHP